MGPSQGFIVKTIHGFIAGRLLKGAERFIEILQVEGREAAAIPGKGVARVRLHDQVEGVEGLNMLLSLRVNHRLPETGREKPGVLLKDLVEGIEGLLLVSIFEETVGFGHPRLKLRLWFCRAGLVLRVQCGNG